MCAEPDPGFSAALQEAVAERDAVYRTWTEQGPQLNSWSRRRARLRERPGRSGWANRAWNRPPGTPGLWRIGEATVPDAPEQQPFPAAVPLLDSPPADLHPPGQRGCGRALVQNLLMRVLSYFQPGLVRVHVDALQLTGSLPGLYPLTRAGC